MSKGTRHGDDGLKSGREGLQPIHDFIRTARGESKPFFLWYAPLLPHAPHTPPEALFKRIPGSHRVAASRPLPRHVRMVRPDLRRPHGASRPRGTGGKHQRLHVTLKQREPVTGTRVGEDENTLSIAQAGGQIAKLKKADIVKTEPMTISLRPEGIDKAPTPAELRDLMTYLLMESVSVKAKK